MVADFSNPAAPVGFAPGDFTFTPADPSRPVYISLVAGFLSEQADESFACPSGTSRSSIVSEPAIQGIGTPFPALAPDQAFRVANTTQLDGTLTKRAGVAVTTSTWQLRAVPG